jgi:uncharacterized membrane protein
MQGRQNVHAWDRVAGAALGGALVMLFLRDRSWGRALLAAAGGGLIWRGTTGHCPAYEAVGVDTAAGAQGRSYAAVPPEQFEAERSITIERPVEELETLWQTPQLMATLIGQDTVVLPKDHVARFEPAEGGQGTRMTLRALFQPPAGPVGEALAERFGPIVPAALVEKALARFKAMAEAREPQPA